MKTTVSARLAFAIPFSPLVLAFVLVLFQAVSADELRVFAEAVLPFFGSLTAFLPLPSDAAPAPMGISQISVAIHPVTIFMIGFCVATLVLESALCLLTFGPSLSHLTARHRQLLNNPSFKPFSRKVLWVIAAATALVIFDLVFSGYLWGIILFRETGIPRGVLGILIRLGMIFTTLNWFLLFSQAAFFLFLSQKLEHLRNRGRESAS